jgi:hypothetical protein
MREGSNSSGTVVLKLWVQDVKCREREGRGIHAVKEFLY